MRKKNINVEVEIEERVLSVTLKRSWLAQHVDYNPVQEVMLTDRIPLQEGMGSEEIDTRIDESAELMQRAFIRIVQMEERNPFIMQRITKYPQLIMKTGNFNGSETKLPKEYFAHFSRDPDRSRDASQPQQEASPTPPPAPPEEAPASTSAQVDTEVEDKPGPAAEPDKAPVSPPQRKDIVADKLQNEPEGARTDQEIATEVQRLVREHATAGPVMFNSIRQRMMRWCSAERLNDIVSDLVDMRILMEPRIGLLQLVPADPPAKPATSTHPIESGARIVCPDCKRQYTIEMNGDNPCPFCGSIKSMIDQPKKSAIPNGNGTLDGSTQVLVDGDRPVCPLCRDADTDRTLLKADVQYSQKLHMPIAACKSHREEWYTARNTPAVKGSLIGSYGKIVEKYRKAGLVWEVAQ